MSIRHYQLTRINRGTPVPEILYSVSQPFLLSVVSAQRSSFDRRKIVAGEEFPRVMQRPFFPNDDRRYFSATEPLPFPGLRVYDIYRSVQRPRGCQRRNDTAALADIAVIEHRSGLVWTRRLVCAGTSYCFNRWTLDREVFRDSEDGQTLQYRGFWKFARGQIAR